MKIDEMIETHIFKIIIVVIWDEGGVQPKLVDPYKWHLVVKTRNWHKHSFDMHTNTLIAKWDFVTRW